MVRCKQLGKLAKEDLGVLCIVFVNFFINLKLLSIYLSINTPNYIYNENITYI